MTVARGARLAIVGCGAVVQHHLIPALRRIGWHPAVLVDPSSANLEAAKRRVRDKSSVRTAPDWTQAVDLFDAAIVAAPHVLHGPIGAGLARAGKHIFMEKPLAIKKSESDEVIAAAREAEIVLSVGLLRRYLHVARWTKALISSGALGSIVRFEAREGFVFNWAITTDALLRQEMSGGGVLMDTGAHTLDLMLWWLGSFTTLTYRDDSSDGGVEADCVLECQLESGGSGSIELSRSRELPNTCWIEGTRGFVEVHLYRNEVRSCSSNVREFKFDGMGVGAFPEQRFPELFSGELANFRSDIIDGTSSSVSGEEAARSVEVIERCYRKRKPLVFPWSTTARRTNPDAILPSGSIAVVTGATGFIGGRIVERLLEQGVKVQCLVRSSASAVRLARLPVEIKRCDLAEASAVETALAGVDYVFHCAHDFRSRGQNLIGARNIVKASIRHGVGRLVYVSTFSVYEPFPDGVLTEETPEGDRSWEYTRTKLEIESEILLSARDGKLNATVIQPSIVYGPFSKPWTIAPAEMLLYGTVVLPDRGEGICNAVYVDDLVEAMFLAARKPEAIGQRFLISGPKPAAWSEFFERIATALECPGPEYRPHARIARENSGLLHDIKLVAKNPKKIIQLAVRIGAVRTMLQSGLDAMPKPLHDMVSRFYFGSGDRPRGEIHLPDPQLLRLYSSRAIASSNKARRLLGYQPIYDFPCGMALTEAYLRWAYGKAQPRSGTDGLSGADFETEKQIVGDIVNVE